LGRRRLLALAAGELLTGARTGAQAGIGDTDPAAEIEETA
jgi:hypothetical protein